MNKYGASTTPTPQSGGDNVFLLQDTARVALALLDANPPSEPRVDVAMHHETTTSSTPQSGGDNNLSLFKLQDTARGALALLDANPPSEPRVDIATMQHESTTPPTPHSGGDNNLSLLQDTARGALALLDANPPSEPRVDIAIHHEPRGRRTLLASGVESKYLLEHRALAEAALALLDANESELPEPEGDRNPSNIPHYLLC